MTDNTERDALIAQEPRDDEREALVDAMINVPGVDGQVEFAADDREPAGYLADAILAAGFRKRPKPDDATLARAERGFLDAYGFQTMPPTSWRKGIHAALVAALTPAAEGDLGQETK